MEMKDIKLHMTGLAFFQHIKIRYKKVKRKSNVRLYIFRLFIIYITLQGNVRVKLRVMWRNVMVMKGNVFYHFFVWR